MSSHVLRLNLYLCYGIQDVSCCDTQLEIVAPSLQTLAQWFGAPVTRYSSQTLSEWDPAATCGPPVRERDPLAVQVFDISRSMASRSNKGTIIVPIGHQGVRTATLQK